MSKTHSPGPWRMVQFNSYNIPDELKDGNNKTICAIECALEADAALIAAAPEMLEMLKELARYDDEMYRVDSYYAMNAELRENLNELIAKAEGNVPAKKTE